MIDFDLGDELELVRATARDFANDALRPALREHEADRAPGASSRSAFGEIGFSTLEWPESLGGSGLGSLARCVVLEELAAGDPGAALALDPLGPALYPILELGGDDALRELGGPLVRDDASRAVLVWNGSGARGRVERTGDRVRGRVPWVPADRVDLLVVLDEEGAFAVREGLEAVAVRGAGLRAAGASEVRVESAPVAWSARDPSAAARALARARLYAAALLVGVMRESSDFARGYAQEREAFGRPIAHHQALAFLITDLWMAVEGTRLLVQQAAWLRDEGRPFDEACATAFVEAAEQAMFVTPNGVQILGGHGFMQDYPVEKMMREARALGLWLGGGDAAREDAGRALAESGVPVPLGAEGSA